MKACTSDAALVLEEMYSPNKTSLQLIFLLELPALGNDDLLVGLAALRADGLNRLHDVHALEDLAEDNWGGKDAHKRRERSTHKEIKEITRELNAPCFPSNHDVTAVVMKNCDDPVFGPRFAIERRPVLVCLYLKFSSSNVSP
jgi:hypothetical protein